jgi:integrase
VAPKPEQRKVIPWKLERVNAVRAGLGDRYKAMVDVGAGCGCRQGEIFGLGVDDIDFDGGWIHVRRQVKRVRARLVFGLPKNDKERKIPLPASVAHALKTHMDAFAPVDVTLPWESPGSKRLVTVRLVFTNARKAAVSRSAFNLPHWQGALKKTGVDPGTARENGTHALRHFYASALLDAG